MSKMNSLLKRQMRKFLGTDNIPPETEDFLDAVNESYSNYEDQIALLQRAMRLSSDELFVANQKLREEAQSLKEVNKNLEFILNSMRREKNGDANNKFNPANYIKKQSAEIVKITQQREKLLQNLEIQNQELNEYAHVVSHDLKSPLRNINTLITWVIEDAENSLSEESKNSLDMILFNIEKMDLLVKGILDYSSIGKLESENRIVDFNTVIEELTRTIALPENIKIRVNNKLPKLYGNFYRFKQLFQNLIDNAVKYNDKEEGLIEIGCEEYEKEVKFYVKDNGVGIPDSYFNKIFNIFTKLDNNDQSSGIGLSIVKKIVTFYGGKVWLESAENTGTTFYFTIQKNGTA